MSVSSLNPIKFIEESLFCTTTLALSYSDPDQKWIIRNHLISLFQNYPSFKPSIDFFTHNNGTEVKLLNISGELDISHNTPPVPLTIWLHELYPQMAPIVHVHSLYPIYENHPFVDSSGLTNSPYLINWQLITKCNLLDLVRNLNKLFSLNHPFYYIESCSSSTHVSMVSKTEAMDSLYGAIFTDMIAIKSKSEEEIENLSIIQGELRERGETAEILAFGLEFERRCLKERINELSCESDKLLSWLKVYEKGCVISYDHDKIEDVFECLDEKSGILIELKAGDNGIEDLMYALDTAVKKGVLNFGSYIKQVRLLAREQFVYRAKIARVEM